MRATRCHSCMMCCDSCLQSQLICTLLIYFPGAHLGLGHLPFSHISQPSSQLLYPRRSVHKQGQQTQTVVIVTASLALTILHPILYQLKSITCSLLHCRCGNIISLTHSLTCASHAVQFELEMRKDGWTPPLLFLLPPRSPSLITYCDSSLHLAILQIPSSQLCLAFSLSLSLLHSPSIFQPS